MPKPVAEQVVVVVGASSGIGRATAVEFARQGATVVAAARNERALGTLVDEITRAGGDALAVRTDVAVASDVYALAERAEGHYGRVDTWVNNAAVAVWGRVDEVTDEEFDRVMRVNFLGQVHGVHAALPVLRRAGGGVLIGVSSAEATRAVPLHASYTASKWAVRALYDCLRMELAESQESIAVTTILPAAIATPFFEHARSKVGAMPSPPPPTYAPQLVAEAIVRAAAEPTREVPVGGAAAGFAMGQRFSPALTDTLMSLTGFAVGAQTSDRPDNGTDNVDAPLPEEGQVEGDHAGPVVRQSPFTRLVAHRRRPGEVLGGVVQRVRRVAER